MSLTFDYSQMSQTDVESHLLSGPSQQIILASYRRQPSVDGLASINIALAGYFATVSMMLATSSVNDVNTVATFLTALAESDKAQGRQWVYEGQALCHYLFQVIARFGDGALDNWHFIDSVETAAGIASNIPTLSLACAGNDSSSPSSRSTIAQLHDDGLSSPTSTLRSDPSPPTSPTRPLPLADVASTIAHVVGHAVQGVRRSLRTAAIAARQRAHPYLLPGHALSLHAAAQGNETRATRRTADAVIEEDTVKGIADRGAMQQVEEVDVVQEGTEQTDSIPPAFISRRRPRDDDDEIMFEFRPNKIVKRFRIPAIPPPSAEALAASRCHVKLVPAAVRKREKKRATRRALYRRWIEPHDAPVPGPPPVLEVPRTLSVPIVIDDVVPSRLVSDDDKMDVDNSSDEPSGSPGSDADAMDIDGPCAGLSPPPPLMLGNYPVSLAPECPAIGQFRLTMWGEMEGSIAYYLPVVSVDPSFAASAASRRCKDIRKSTLKWADVAKEYRKRLAQAAEGASEEWSQWVYDRNQRATDYLNAQAAYEEAYLEMKGPVWMPYPDEAIDLEGVLRWYEGMMSVHFGSLWSREEPAKVPATMPASYPALVTSSVSQIAAIIPTASTMTASTVRAVDLNVTQIPATSTTVPTPAQTFMPPASAPTVLHPAPDAIAPLQQFIGSSLASIQAIDDSSVASVPAVSMVSRPMLGATAQIPSSSSAVIVKQPTRMSSLPGQVFSIPTGPTESSERSSSRNDQASASSSRPLASPTRSSSLAAKRPPTSSGQSHLPVTPSPLRTSTTVEECRSKAGLYGKRHHLEGDLAAGSDFLNTWTYGKHGEPGKGVKVRFPEQWLVEPRYHGLNDEFKKLWEIEIRHQPTYKKTYEEYVKKGQDGKHIMTMFMEYLVRLDVTSTDRYHERLNNIDIDHDNWIRQPPRPSKKK